MLRLGQLPRPFQKAMNVGGLGLGGLVRPEHAIHQGPEPVRLLDDDLGVFAELWRAEGAIEKLGGAANAAEGVLNLMGEAANELSGSFLDPLLLRLPMNAEGAIYREQLEQERWGFAVA
jgi:hypothetical protein